MTASSQPRARENPRLGATLATSSAGLGAVYLISFQAAGQQASRAAVVTATLLWAAVLCTATWATARKRPRLDRITAITAGLLAIFAIVGNVAVGEALVHLDPGLTSVALQTQVLFVAGLAHFAIGEKITFRFAIGAAVALAGFAIVRMPTGQGVVSPAGIAWAITAAATFAAMHVVTRRVIHRIDPVWVNALRLWLAVAGLLVLSPDARTITELTWRPWLLCAVAAITGPFVGRILLMYAVSHLEASRVSLITLSNPVFAFALGYAAFGVVPTAPELAGGAVIVLGIAIPLVRIRA